MTRLPTRNICAFSLLELSVVLTIMALVGSSVLTLGTQSTERSKIELTKRRMEAVRLALARNARNNGLTCPAVTTVGPNNTAFGVANCSTLTTDNIAYIGTVPTRTLVLPDEYAFDAWGRYFTYAVDRQLVRPSAAVVNTKHILETGIATTDAKPNSTRITVWTRGNAAPAVTTRAVMVLVSHGPDGHGAFPAGGGAPINAATGDTAEGENTGNSVTLATFDSEFSMGPASATFDDIVTYAERWQMLEAAGGLVDKELCETIYRANQPYSLTAKPKTGPVGCEIEGGAGLDSTCVYNQMLLADALLPACGITDPGN
jgi:type II secretory pathway pseudopilin PulG